MNNSLRNGLIVLLIIIGGGYYFFQSNSSVSRFFTPDNFSSLGDQVSKTVNGSLQNSGATSNSNPLNEKLNAYVDLLNNVSDNVQSSYDRYAMWCDLKTGPTGKEPNIYGLYQLNDHSRYFQEADRVSKLEPKIALDDIYLQYTQKYQVLKPLADKAYSYYDQKNYQDDNMAQGKSMHAGLVSAFDDFLTVADQLNTEYEKVDQVERKKELQAYKDSGRQVAYAATNVLVTGQQVYTYVRDELAKNDDKVEQLSADGLKAQVDQFEKVLNDLTQIAKDQPAEVKNEYGNTGDSLMESYIRAGSDYLKSMKALYRSLRDKQYIARDAFADNTEGTPENLINTYNKMVDEYNFMGKF